MYEDLTHEHLYCKNVRHANLADLELHTLIKIC